MEQFVTRYENGVFIMCHSSCGTQWYFKKDKNTKAPLKELDAIFGEFLLSQNLIYPVINDFEFTFQKALGLMNSRVFYINKQS